MKYIANTPIDRREAIKLAFALGLGNPLNFDAACTSDAIINATHAKAMQSPETLYVDENGTIFMECDPYDEFPTWREAFSLREIKSFKDVVDVSCECGPLESWINDKIEEIINDRTLEKATEPSAPADINDLESTLTEEEESYLISRVNSMVDEDVSDPEWIPQSATPNGNAFFEFSSWDPDLRRLLGIKLVEGDQPGSSFFGAVIEENLKETNEALRAMGIPLRFEDM